MTVELVTCNSCGMIFNNEKEEEVHVMKTHVKFDKGLRRALIWAKMML